MLPTPPAQPPVLAIQLDNNQHSFGLKEAWASKASVSLGAASG